jgi:hypothetical protein
MSNARKSSPRARSEDRPAGGMSAGRSSRPADTRREPEYVIVYRDGWVCARTVESASNRILQAHLCHLQGRMRPAYRIRIYSKEPS